MALTTIQKDKLQDIADAIRQRKSSSSLMTPGQMPAEILAIPESRPVQTKSASYAANGKYTLTPDSGYLIDQANITVAVPEPLTQKKEEVIRDVNTWHTITPDPGYLLNQVKVLTLPQTQVGYFNVVRNGVFNVEPDEGKLFTNVLVEATVPQINTQTKSGEYTSNGNYVIAPDQGYALSQANVKVAVPAPVVQSKSATYTINGTYTISPDSGYDYLTGATVNVQVPAASANFAKHRFQTSSGGTASWTMGAMTVGESRIQDLVFYYPTMQVTANYKAYLPSTGTYSVQSWGSSNVETKNGGDPIESHTWSYNSSKSGDIGAASTWVVTRLT